MPQTNSFERDQISLLLGIQKQRIAELEEQLATQRTKFEHSSLEWRRLERHRSDLADWLIDMASNEHGQLIQRQIDAGLTGELFVPGTFRGIAHGKRFQFELLSTTYRISDDQ